MPDVFDAVAPEHDIFDEVSSGDVFDQIDETKPAPSPQFSQELGPRDLSAPRLDFETPARTPEELGARNFAGGGGNGIPMTVGEALRPVMAPFKALGQVANAAVQDVGAFVGGNPEGSGNLAALWRQKDESELLPYQETLKSISKSNPVIATAGKAASGLVEAAPIGMASPGGAIGRLIGLGFSADMIRAGGEAATVIGDEMGKDPSERDADRLTSAIGSLATSAVFAPLAAKHGVLGDVVAGKIDPKDAAQSLLNIQPRDRTPTANSPQPPPGVDLQRFQNDPAYRAQVTGVEIPKGEPNAIPVREPTPPIVGETPGGSEEVGARVSGSEKPADVQTEIVPPARTEDAPSEKPLTELTPTEYALKSRQERILQEIDDWETGKHASPGQPYSGANYGRVAREKVNALEKELAAVRVKINENSSSILSGNNQELPTGGQVDDRRNPLGVETPSPEGVGRGPRVGVDKLPEAGGVDVSAKVEPRHTGIDVIDRPNPDPETQRRLIRSAIASNQRTIQEWKQSLKRRESSAIRKQISEYQNRVRILESELAITQSLPISGEAAKSQVAGVEVPESDWVKTEPRKKHLYRGMEPDEFTATVAQGKGVLSKNAGIDEDGTSFNTYSAAHVASDYALHGDGVLTEPRPLGYVVEVKKSGIHASSPSSDPGELVGDTETPFSDVTRAWEVRSKNGQPHYREVQLPKPNESKPEHAKQLEPKDILGSVPVGETARPTPTAKTQLEKPKASENAPTETQQNLIGMGGAIPEEFVPQRGTATGIKNAKVDEERAARGLEPIMQPERLANQTAWDRAMAKIDADPGWQDRLIDELQKRPRATTPEETLALDHRYVDLQNSADKLSRELAQAYDDSLQFPERNADVAELRVRQERAAKQLDEFENLVKKTGTETGRSLQIRKRLLNEDFTLGALEAKRRAAKGGAPLTDAERAELVKIADDYKKANAELEGHLKTRDERVAQLEAEAAIKQIKKEAVASPEYHPKIIQIAEKIVAGLDKRADAARQRIKERGFRFNTGVDPTVLRDVAEIGAAHLGHKVLEFAKWSDRMISEFGEGIKPHLDEIFAASNKLINDLKAHEKVKRAVKGTDTGEKIENAKSVIKERIEKGERGEIGSQVQRIARLLVQRGIRETEALIDATHAIVSEIDPTMTRSQTRDAISGYGDFRQLSKDEVAVALRGMKGEMQQIAKLEDMAKGVPPSKTGMERRTPTDKERALIKAVNEAKIKFQVPITDPSTQLKSALDTRKAVLKTRMEELERRMREKDFSKKERRKLELDKDAEKLTYDLFAVKKRYYEMLMKDRLANRSTFGKIIGGVGEVANTSRAILTSLDLSAVLRQGGMIALAHPIRASKAFPAMFKALRSEAGQHAVDVEILKRPNYPQYAASKLYLSEHGQKLSQMEEAYMSRWADKIPLVAASQRAYVTFLNKLRADSFDAMAKSLTADGNLSKAEADAISNYINVATGRGNLGAKENALVGLNTVFFAPRYVASRFQMLAGQPLYKGTAGTRKLIAQEYARYLAGVAVVYALGQVAGAHIETDPRSSDFGKMRFGNTRVDPLSGLAQTTTFLSRMASGKTKTLGGKVMPAKSTDTVANFLRGKLAPPVGMGLDARDIALGQKTPPGHPKTFKELGQGAVVPLAFSDIYAEMKEQGVPAGAAIAILSLLGMGVQTYDDKKK